MKSELEGFRQLQENRKNAIRTESLSRKEQLMDERDKQKREIAASFEEKLRVAEKKPSVFLLYYCIDFAVQNLPQFLVFSP